MNNDELVKLFSSAEHPLAEVLRWWQGDGFRGVSVLKGVLARCGRLEDPSLLRTITRVGQEFATREKAAASDLANELGTWESPAALLLAAVVHEALGQFQVAARLFQSVAHLTKGEVRALCFLGHARHSARSAQSREAGAAWVEAVRSSSSARTLASAAAVLKEIEQSGVLPSRRSCRVGLVGSVTLDLLVPVLRVVCCAEGIRAEFWAGSFGQYVQEVLDPASGLASFKPDVVIIATDWQSLGLPDESPAPSDAVKDTMAKFQLLWRECRDRLHAHVIQFNFEVPLNQPFGRMAAVLPGGRATVLREINQAFFEAEFQGTGMTILDVDLLAGAVGKGVWSDPALWIAARQYPSAIGLPALARSLSAVMRALFGLSAKCLVLDLDGTLWGGVIGEDGMDGIKLGGGNSGEAYVAFQRHILALKTRGVLLAVCSKNNENDAQAPFRSHPEMVLTLSDISVFTANWRSKDENLREIAGKLNIGLDSLVFVDDNPVERRWVKQQLPEIEVIDLPEDPARFIEALESHLPFETLSLSYEDRGRVQAMRENQARENLQRTSATVQDYLASLGMEVELQAFDRTNLQRITQLINKTNQFNLTTRRLTQSQVESLLSEPGVFTQMMRLRDQYGDYGLTGVLIARGEGQSIRIESWLLSCRVMGRSVENVMMAALMRTARAAGFTELIGEYIPSAKNSAVSELYSRLGFDPVGAGPSQSYRWNLSAEPLPFPAGLKVSNQTAAPVPAR